MNRLVKPDRLRRGDTVAAISISDGRAGDGDLLWRYQLGKKRLCEIFGLHVVETPNALFFAFAGVMSYYGPNILNPITQSVRLDTYTEQAIKKTLFSNKMLFYAFALGNCRKNRSGYFLQLLL